MGILNEWIFEKLGEIAKEFPDAIKDENKLFKRGYFSGYKTALLELDRLLEDSPVESKELYEKYDWELYEE